MLPPSFAHDGFVLGPQARKRLKLPNGALLKPLLIGTEGETNTGKSEFLMSCPTPSKVIALDRGFDGMFDNPNPPAARRTQVGFKVIPIPLNMMAPKASYESYYKDTREEYYKALADPSSITVAIDGDSDFWELQRLAEFGKLTQVFPQTKYGDVYAQRRAMTARAWDSGKIVIGTNKVRDEFETMYRPDGQPEKESDGSDKKRKTGNKQRQGFPDQDYLWELQLRHLYSPPRINTVTGKEVAGCWGLRILKCKANAEHVGSELWGKDCCFAGLVHLIYPQVPDKEWNL